MKMQGVISKNLSMNIQKHFAKPDYKAERKAEMEEEERRREEAEAKTTVGAVKLLIRKVNSMNISENHNVITSGRLDLSKSQQQKTMSSRPPFSPNSADELSNNSGVNASRNATGGKNPLVQSQSCERQNDNAGSSMRQGILKNKNRSDTAVVQYDELPAVSTGTRSLKISVKPKERMAAVKDKIKVDEKDVVKEDAYLEDLASPYFKFKPLAGSGIKKNSKGDGFSNVTEKWKSGSQSVDTRQLRT